jgi:hypothetical protein
MKNKVLRKKIEMLFQEKIESIKQEKKSIKQLKIKYKCLNLYLKKSI